MSPGHHRLSVRILADSVSAGLVGAVRSLSLAALVFGGLGLAEARAFGPILIGAGILGLVIALTSGLVGTPQSNAAAVVAVAAGLVTASSTGSVDEQFALVMATMAVASISTGLVLYLAGVFKLGRLVRFLPYPVVGGFLAATGWLLLTGGWRLAQNASATWITFATLGFGLAIAVAAQVDSRWMQPAVVGIGLVLFFVAMAVGGVSLEEAGVNGWLVGPFAADPVQFSDLFVGFTADMSQLAPAIPTLLTIPAVALLSLLLNASAIEVGEKVDLPLDVELKAAGLGNVAGGLVGSLPGWQSLTLQKLVKSSRTNKVGAVIVALVSLSALAAGPRVIGYLPVFVVAGVVAGLGLDLLYEWVVASRSNVSVTDYSIVLIVVVVTAGFGFVSGVITGVLAAIGLFIYQYSKIDVVQVALSGDSYRSNVDRPVTDNDRLTEAGGAIAIFRIHGFVFFGTANRLIGELRARMEPEIVRFLVVDGKRVTGFDGSALHVFERFLETAAEQGVTTVLTGFGPLGEKVAAAEAAETVVRFHTLDEGLEWAEDQILSSEDSLFGSVEAQLAEIAGPWADGVFAMMERVEFGVGDTIIAEGSVGHPIYVIEYGRVRVVLEATGTRLRTMRPGAIVGEMAYYTRQPANASVVAETEVVAYALSESKLEGLLSTNPRLAAEVHRRMAGSLSRRVTETNTALRKAME